MRAWRAFHVVHPFPSALDAGVTGLVVVLSGGVPSRAALLGASMLLLQFAIGAANDWADAAADALARPDKPIAAGLIGRAQALAIAVVCGLAGLGLAAVGGPALLAVGLVGLLVGLSYDLGLKATPWAWLPFAAGFTLLPLFAWLGGAGGVPPFMGWIAGLAVLAGAAVSLANGLVDLEGDRSVARFGPAVRLGRRATLRLLLGLHLSLAAGAVASLVLAGVAGPYVWAGIATGGALQGAGWLVSNAVSRGRRLLGWRVQALGLATLAGAWFYGMAA